MQWKAQGKESTPAPTAALMRLTAWRQAGGRRRVLLRSRPWQAFLASCPGYGTPLGAEAVQGT